MENGVQHANAKLILPDGTEVELPLLQVSGMLSLHKYFCKFFGADLPLSVTTDANHQQCWQDASGARFVDIRKLQTSTGLCTFDPGFTSTGTPLCAESAKPRIIRAHDISGMRRLLRLQHHLH